MIGRCARAFGWNYRAVVLVACFQAASLPAVGEETPPDLSDLSLEDLARVEIVQAASRREEEQRKAPSSVTVVTAEQIRRAGFHTLADVLRSVAGFYVTEDRNYSYVGVRGFGRPGDYNTRILVLIDGFRLNDNVYDMAPVGYDFPVDVDLIERVEVVRGPGAAMYGNSAFFAVINVVTKRGRDVGAVTTATAGRFGTWLGRGSYGRRFSSGLEVLGSLTLGASDGEDLFFPEFDQPGLGRAATHGLDDERFHSLHVSASLRGVSLLASHVSREKGIPTASYGTLFGDPRSATWDDRTVAALKYEGQVARAWRGFARVHYGRYSYRGHYAFDDAEGGLELDYSLGEWWGLDAGLQSHALGRHRWTVGGELQDNARQDQGWSYANEPGLRFDSFHDSSRWALYAQDELRVSESLTAHVGVRHDRGPSSGNRTSPRLGLVLAHGPSTLKILYGTAFRAPNEYELHYYEASESLRPETIQTIEAVAERYLGSRWRLCVSLFDNRIDHLISLQDDRGDLGFVNTGLIDSRGIEAALETKLRSGLRAQITYSFQRSTDRETGRPLTNSPRHLLKLGVAAPIVEERLAAGLDVQYLSRRATLAGNTLPGFVLANLTLRAPRVVGNLDASLGAYNLLDTRYSDPGSEEHRQDALPQPRRSLQLRLGWRF